MEEEGRSLDSPKVASPKVAENTSRDWHVIDNSEAGQIDTKEI